MGSGAIFSFADGQQRAIPIGREVAPGLALKSVGIGHAVLGGADGDLRLDLHRFGASAASAPAAVPASPSPATPGGAMAQATHRRETTAFRLGLAPVRGGATGGGYAIRPGARIPHLPRAGLQAGDVIVRVNGSAFDAERLTELSWEIANASTTEIEFIRRGRRMKTALRKQ